MSASHFRQLEVWRLAVDLTKAGCELTAGFPNEARYGLSSQWQRAAVPIPSNIAEGYARSSARDYARCISMAPGLSAEWQTQLLLTSELNLVNEATRSTCHDLCDRAGQVLVRLRQALMRKLETEPRVPSPESRISEFTEDYR